MKALRVAPALVLFIALFSGCAPRQAQQPSKRGAPLLKGLDVHSHPITTSDPMAQRYFDQGLVLAFGFNHAEARRSFQEAAKIDPNCAMCFWGEAFVLGPNINAPMGDEAVPQAYAAIQQALSLAPKVSPREQAYIHAMSKRYASKPSKDRSALDAAFTEAMGEVVQRFPDDMDARSIYAEAQMDQHPWDYWNTDGSPKEWTPQILDTINGVLERHENHPLALHLHIHAVEASSNPELALPSADRLRDLVPGAGHLVHMPSHIYIRTGRYHDATLANQRAVQVDDDYVTQCHAQGLYPLAYMPHNHHFLWASAVMEGQGKLAVDTAWELQRRIDKKKLHAPGVAGVLQHFYAIPYFTLVTFEGWDEMLQVAAPPEDLVYPTAVWRYARGMANAARGDTARARAELRMLDLLAADKRLEGLAIWELNKNTNILEIASVVLAGEIAAREGHMKGAVTLFQKAVDLEDALIYEEPSSWFPPVRPRLGVALLAVGDAQGAELVYRKDLEKYPNNGWALAGLIDSLDSQGKKKLAADAMKDLEGAWSHSEMLSKVQRDT